MHALCVGNHRPTVSLILILLFCLGGGMHGRPDHCESLRCYLDGTGNRLAWCLVASSALLESPTCRLHAETLLGDGLHWGDTAFSKNRARRLGGRRNARWRCRLFEPNAHATGRGTSHGKLLLWSALARFLSWAASFLEVGFWAMLGM